MTDLYLFLAYYNDEGSRDYEISESVVNVKGNHYGNSEDVTWWQPNERDLYTTGNITISKVAVAAPGPLQLTDGNGYGDRVYDITNYDSLDNLQAPYGTILYNAGIPSMQRPYRAVSFTYPSPNQ